MVYQNTVSKALPEANVYSATLSKFDSEDLPQLEPRELVNIVRKLKAELARKSSILYFFMTTSQTMAEKDAVITVLDLVVNISATR